MSFERLRSGKTGEDSAVAFLGKKGYRVIERNFKNDLGEIDIIAWDKGTLCFIEVKTRTSDIFGSPFESVTAAKQKKLIRTAQSYLKFTGQSDVKARFDVIAVMLTDARVQSIDIVRNAFEM